MSAMVYLSGLLVGLVGAELYLWLAARSLMRECRDALDRADMVVYLRDFLIALEAKLPVAAPHHHVVYVDEGRLTLFVVRGAYSQPITLHEGAFTVVAEPCADKVVAQLLAYEDAKRREADRLASGLV